MFKDARQRFSATAENYHLYRPSYPSELIDWIIKTTGLSASSVIADIGCGTGISTRLFSERGFTTIGVDPNEDMLTFARINDSTSDYQKGEAVHTGLAKSSIDLIIVAQAFHWFDIEPTFVEFKKILKPDGWVCAFWNIREKTEFLREYEALLRTFSGDYEKTPKAKDSIEEIKNSPLITSIEENQCLNFQKLNFDGLIGRAYSTSYVTHGVKDHEGFRKALKKLFDRYEQKDTITFIYKTVALAWQFA